MRRRMGQHMQVMKGVAKKQGLADMTFCLANLVKVIGYRSKGHLRYILPT